MTMYNILVAEDELDLCEILHFNLEKEGYNVVTVSSAEEALTKDLSSFHLFLLDVMMGKMNGFQLAREIKSRKELENKPIVFLTAKNEEMDKLIGYKAGAEDYISKPFSVKELTAKIKVILHRAYPALRDNQANIHFGPFKIDYNSKSVLINNVQIDLTRKEFEIIYLLARKPGRVFSRNELLTYVWQDEGEINDRTVDVNIRRIRKKLGDLCDIISTRSGYGYLLNLNFLDGH